MCDFKPSGDHHCWAFHRCGVQETKGECAPLDRSLVTLMAQESLIETIGAKRTLEIANIRSQLSCWYADRKIKKKNKEWGRKGRQRKEKSFHVSSSALRFDLTNRLENLPVRNPDNLNIFTTAKKKKGKEKWLDIIKPSLPHGRGCLLDFFIPEMARSRPRHQAFARSSLSFF